MKRAVAVFAGFMLFSCSPFDEVRDAQHFGDLINRCIRLRTETTVLRSTGDQTPSSLYLDTSESSIDKLIARVPAGTSVRVTRVIYKKSFEFTTIVVLAHIPRVERDVSISLLFVPGWLGAATRLEERGEQGSIGLKSALDPRMAEWCDGSN